MRRVMLLAVIMLCAGGAVTVAHAQKPNPPLITQDSDRDGIPNLRDRCERTPAGTTVDANGCAAPARPATPTQSATTPTPNSTPTLVPGTPTNPPANAQANPTTSGNAAAQPKPGTPPPPGLPTNTGVQQQAQPGTGATPNNTATPSTTTTPGRSNAPPANSGTGTPAVVTPPVTVTPPANTAANPQPANPQPVNPQPANPPPPRAQPNPPPDPGNTAGFWVSNYVGVTDAEKYAYARNVVVKMDSALRALAELYRNTNPIPVPDARSPSVLAPREKRRWAQCRLIQFDLRTMSDALTFLKDSIAGGATLVRETGALFTALDTMEALEECDHIASAIEAPDSWNPFQQNYEQSVRLFFRGWYGQLRATHEANRAFARALNAVLTTNRLPNIAALPVTPPTIGAAR